MSTHLFCNLVCKDASVERDLITTRMKIIISFIVIELSSMYLVSHAFEKSKDSFASSIDNHFFFHSKFLLSISRCMPVKTRNSMSSNKRIASGISLY
mmetsp:Transcript_14503/g.33767  ORF Transcript_14503/g.33767 Transcript_14503/m.33767 type:complete len:97 (+) Transcript_14503:1494-1784(+)